MCHFLETPPIDHAVLDASSRSSDRDGERPTDDGGAHQGKFGGEETEFQP